MKAKWIYNDQTLYFISKYQEKSIGKLAVIKSFDILIK